MPPPPPPREQQAQSFVVSVTGSNIPIRVFPTNTGNFNDRNVNNHVAETHNIKMGGKEGKTTSVVTTDRYGANNIVVNHDLNWWVKESAKNTDVVTREIRDHVNHWRYWWKEGEGYDALHSFAKRGFQGTFDQAVSALRSRMENANSREFRSQRDTYDFDPFGRRQMPHDTRYFPAKPISPEELSRVLSTIN